jgi:radical SAM superfamily enzyme YgiQ (UPF0313 family)
MRLTLIFPAIGKRRGKGYLRLWQMEPLSMAVLAALTPRDIEVRFYDDRLEDIPFDEPTDLVAMTVETYTARRAYQIASEYRRRRVPVVMGGFHPSLCPDEVARFADTVVQGEGEGLWERLLDDYRRGTPQKIYRHSSRPVLNGLLPRREIFRGKRYLPLGLVEAGRGCTMPCEFCAIQSVYQGTHQQRPVETITTEIESLRRCRRSFFFVDDNLALDPAYTRELLRAITPLRIRWLGQMSVTTAQDEELVELLQRSGCAGVLIGFESLREEGLAAMRKPFNLGPRSYRQAMANLRQRGIGVFGTFVFGYEHDTAETVTEALEFAQQEGFYLAAFNHLVPFPGTPVYCRLEAESRLLNAQWWLDPQYRFNQVAFRPGAIEPAELRERCLAARRAFYSPRSTWRRHQILARGLSVKERAIFWALNLMHRAEVHHRDGFPLGDESWQGQLLEAN